MKANTKNEFDFKFINCGKDGYCVRYTSPIRRDYWIATINDLTLIDVTYNTFSPKVEDLAKLRNIVKKSGSHYNRRGVLINKR